VARKKLVSQIISITMYISTVVPNIMLLTATPACNMEGQISISSRSSTTINEESTKIARHALVIGKVLHVFYAQQQPTRNSKTKGIYIYIYSALNKRSLAWAYHMHFPAAQWS